MSEGDPAIVAAMIGAGTSLGVLAVSTLWTHHRDRLQRRQEAEIARLDAQIRDLFGPLDTLIRHILIVHALREDMLERMKKRDGELTDETAHQIRYWFWKHHFIPIHDEIQSLIRRHLDLLEGKMPESFESYLRHSICEQMRYRLREETDSEIETFEIRGERWNRDFERDVSAALRRALARRNQLLGRTGQKPQ